MPAPKSVLVVSLRYFGDLLLTTPLIRAVARGFEGAAVDVLVTEGAGAVLEGNADVRNILTVATRPRLGESAALVRRLWRRYDLAVIAETGDRPHLYGFFAASRRAGLLAPEVLARWWKAPRLDVTRESYAVVNVAPRFRYKRWHVRGWCALFEWLHARGMRIVVSGGNAPEEREYVHEILAESAVPTIDIGGRLGFGETADLLRGAALYVGPDTATSHLAAACGTPSVVLFGPTDPRLWGPIPRRGLATPYAAVAASQRRGNVLLLQEPSLSCVPCQREGCERHRESFSACLDALTAASAIEAAQALLTRSAVSTRT